MHFTRILHPHERRAHGRTARWTGCRIVMAIPVHRREQHPDDEPNDDILYLAGSAATRMSVCSVSLDTAISLSSHMPRRRTPEQGHLRGV